MFGLGFLIFFLYSVSFPRRNTSINEVNSSCTDTQNGEVSFQTPWVFLSTSSVTTTFVKQHLTCKRPSSSLTFPTHQLQLSAKFYQRKILSFFLKASTNKHLFCGHLHQYMYFPQEKSPGYACDTSYLQELD